MKLIKKLANSANLEIMSIIILSIFIVAFMFFVAYVPVDAKIMGH